MLASHNSFTYQKPQKWWMYLLNFSAKCQSKDWKYQLKMGVTSFDLRVRLYKGEFYICHGIVRYELAEDTLKKLIIYYRNKTNKKLYIRLLLEGKKDVIAFRNFYYDLWKFCKNFHYNKIIFHEGRYKTNWENLINLPSFNNDFYKQECGSMNSIIGKICPWLYYKLNKRQLLEKQTKAYLNDNQIINFDFIYN